MVCPRCKKIVPDDSPFCMNCGKMVIKDKKSQKVTAIIIVSAILVVAAVVIIGVLLSIGKRENEDFITAKGTLNHRCSSNDRVFVLFDKDREILRLEDAYGLVESSVKYDAYRTCAVIKGSDKTLYYYDGKELHTIEIENDIINDFLLSYDGSAVVYSTLSERLVPIGGTWTDQYVVMPGGRPAIYRFKAEDNESEPIAKDATIRCISPDGNTVAYRQWPNDDTGYTDVAHDYCYDGAYYKFDKDLEIFAVANGGKYIYCNRYSDTVPHPGNEDGDDEIEYGLDYTAKEMIAFRGYDDKTGVSLGQNSVFYPVIAAFNVDLSEAIVTNFDGRYIWNGTETVKVSDLQSGRFLPVMPRNGVCCPGGNYIIYGVKTFAEKFFTVFESSSDYISLESSIFIPSLISSTAGSLSGEKVCYIDSGFKRINVADSAVSATVTDDGKTLFFLTGDGVCKAVADGSDTVPKTVCEGKFKCFAASSDGRTLFLVTSNNDLYTKTGDAEEQFVTDGIDERDVVSTYLYQGRYLYIYRENKLYRTGGGYPRRVGSMRSNITGYDFYGDALYVYTASGGESKAAVYASERGNSIKLHVEF